MNINACALFFEPSVITPPATDWRQLIRYWIFDLLLCQTAIPVVQTSAGNFQMPPCPGGAVQSPFINWINCLDWK